MRLRSSDASVRVPVWVCGNSCYPGWGVKYPVRSRRLPAGAPATGFRSPQPTWPPAPLDPVPTPSGPCRRGLSAGRDLGSAASAQRPPCPGGDLRPPSGRAVTLLGGRGASGPPHPAPPSDLGPLQGRAPDFPALRPTPRWQFGGLARGHSFRPAPEGGGWRVRSTPPTRR